MNSKNSFITVVGLLAVMAFGFFLFQGVQTLPTAKIDTNGQLAQVAPTSGMIGYWAFDEGSGSSVANGSGSGSLSLSGTSWTSSVAMAGLGQALSFDGSSSRASGSISPGSSVITVALWLNWNNYSNNDALAMELSDNYNNNANTFIIDPNAASGAFEFGIRGSSFNTYRVENISRPSAGSWHHYAVIFDNSSSAGDIRVFVDGSEQSTTVRVNSKASSGNFGSYPLYLMSRGGSLLFGSGILDEVRVYDRALSDSEISSVYQYSGATAQPPAPQQPVPNETPVADPLPLPLPLPPPPAADTTAPTISGIAVSAISSGATVSWTTNEASDTQIEYYPLTIPPAGQSYLRTTLVSSSVTTHSQSISGLESNTLYHYRLNSKDAAGNLATLVDKTFTTAKFVDNIAPTAPSNLSATPISSTQINLSWTASTDNIGVIGYYIYRCQGEVCTPTSRVATVNGATSFSNTGLKANTTYQYAVEAYDGANLKSLKSSVAVAATQLATSLSQDIIAYWQLNQFTLYSDPSYASAPDSSGNGNTLMLRNFQGGSPVVAGRVNNAIIFDGVNDYGTVQSVNLSDTNDVSVSFWLNESSYSTFGTIFESSADYNGQTNGFGFFQSDPAVCGAGKLEVSLKGDVGYNIKCYASPTPGWHHYTVIYNKGNVAGSEISLYIDGSLKSATSQPNSANNTNDFGTNPFYMMSRGGSTLFVSGTLDDVRIYKRKLSSTEISQLSKYTGLSDSLTPPASNTLRLSKGGTGTGTVTSSPAGINCGNTCSTSVAQGTFVNLTASPASGSTFTGWTNCTPNTSNPLTCRVLMSSEMTVIASFSNPLVAADTVNPSAPGSVRITGITSNQLTISWNVSTDNIGVAGYKLFRNGATEPFTTVLGTAYTDTQLSADTPYSYAVSAYDVAGNDSSLSVISTRTQPTGSTKFSLGSNVQVSSGPLHVRATPNGTSRGTQPTYAQGTIISNTPSYAGGLYWWNVTYDLPSVGCTITATQTCRTGWSSENYLIENVVAPYSLVVGKNGNGSGTVTSIPAGINCGGDCTEGYFSPTSVTLTPVVVTGSTFSGWSGACNNVTGNCVVNVNSANVSVTATFVLIPIIIDTYPPIISGISSTSALNGATITWTTDEPSDTQIDYGLTNAYGSNTALSPSLVTTPHTQTIIGLASGTTYHYRVKSRDAAGNLGVSTDQIFTTTLDTIAPTVTAFNLGTPTGLVVPLSFTATDNVGVTGYAITETNTAPITGWTTVPSVTIYSPSLSYTFATAGAKTLYTWAKDLAGNVSTSRSASVTITAGNAVYIRDGGIVPNSTGSNCGADWVSACDDLPSSLTRGKIYYVAGGTYGAHTFNDSGTTIITIKKATAADHGTDDSGWNALSLTQKTGETSFRSSGTVFTFNTGGYDIDGVYGQGKSSGTYGIRLYSTASRTGTTVMVLFGGGSINNVSFRHIDFDWNNGTGTSSTGITRHLYVPGSSDNITFENSYFHHSSGFVFYIGPYDGGSASQGNPQNHYTIRNNYFYMNGGGGGESAHWETFWLMNVNDSNIYNNIFEDTFGSSGQTGWVMMAKANNVNVYGNLFFCTITACATGGNGVVSAWSADRYVNDRVNIFNNTFANLKGIGTFTPSITFDHDSAVDTNIVVKNNLYHNTAFDWSGVTTHSNEACGGGQSCAGSNSQTGITTSKFVNYAGKDFRLASATNSGDSTIGSQYATDMLDNTRGTGGTWDRGAYEYTGTVANTAPTITTHPLSQTAPAGSTVTFSAGASGTPTPTYQWQKNGANISGATSASYTTLSLTSSDNGATYRVVATNSVGTATSNNATVTVAVVPIGSNPIAYWNLNETSGTTAADTSGASPSHPATLVNGPTWTTGVSGNGLSLNGTNAYASVANIPLTQFSISAWVNMSANQSGWGSIAMKQNSHGLEVQNGVVYANIGNGTGWTNITQAPLASGVWKHVAQTYDGTTNRLYVDGVLATSGAGAFTNTSANFLIGSWDGSSEFFNGKIDEARVYDRALTATEVATLHDAIVIPSTKFTINDRAQVFNVVSFVSVRVTPSTTGTLLGTQSLNALGTIIGGSITANGYNWWNVNYDSGADGWSIEDYLTDYASPSLPTATLSASPSAISSGQSSTLTWSSTNATSCTGTGGTFAGAKATSGNQTISNITTTTTYSITCTGASGTSPVASATVTIGTPSACTGTCYYIRAGATGANNGTSWTDAYTSIPAFTRGVNGVTYYVADGTYAPRELSTPASGGKVITIKKATVQDHGTNTGWNDSYGDGTATFSGGMSLLTSDWVIDGQTGGGPGNWKGTNIGEPFGFYLKTSGIGFRNWYDSSVSNVAIKHFMIEGGGRNGCETSWDGGYHIALMGSFSNITLSHLYLKDSGRMPIYATGHNGLALEYSYIQRNESLNSPCEQHAEGIHALDHTNSTIRYNVWEDIEGTAVMALRGSGFKVYGNLIYATDGPGGYTSNGSISAAGSGAVVTNSQIYNNTIANTRGVGQIAFPGGSGNIVRNNLFFNVSGGGVGGGVSTNTNNMTATTNPFVSSGSNTPEGYALISGSAPVNAGASLTSEYAKDIVNVIRPRGVAWDIGAYEYTGAGASINSGASNLAQVGNAGVSGFFQDNLIKIVLVLVALVLIGWLVSHRRKPTVPKEPTPPTFSI